MSLETIALSALIKNIEEENGDYLTFATTTNLTTNNAIVSTTLKQYDGSRDGFFDKWWVYFNTTLNASAERKVGAPATTTYATSTGTLTAVGAAFAAESTATTCYLTKYQRTHYVNAITEAVKRIYPAIHKQIDNQTLITGNILPDASFESWSSTSALTWYTTSTGTLLKNTTTTYLKNGTYSTKFTAGAANDYFYISSKTYPRLLDLQGKTVSLYCWAYPQTANDAYIVIYTMKSDGVTAQTLTSSTVCPAGYFTELALENQTLNDDLEEVQIRFKVKTSGQYTYFDDSCLVLDGLQEFLLPDDFIDGHVSQVYVQTDGHLSPIAYDSLPFGKGSYEAIQNFYVVRSGGYKYIQIPDYSFAEARIRLIGFAPLETLSADTDTVTIDSEKVPLLIALAKYIFWKREAQLLSVQDKSKATDNSNEALFEYRTLLGQLSMSRPIELVKR